MTTTPRIRWALAVALCAVLAAACGAEGPSIAPSSQTTAADSSPAVTPVAPREPATPAPTPDVSHPLGMIAIGHSGLTGEGTGATYMPVLANSWATGTSPEVDSVYLRLVAERPAMAGHVANAALGGAKAVALASQATSALRHEPVPELAIIATIDNDINCDGRDADQIVGFGQSVQKALDTIVTASPNVKILIVGQMGRPDPEFVKTLVAKVPAVRDDMMTWGACALYGPDGKQSTKGFDTLRRIIQSFEDEQARVCALYPQCRTDGGVRAGWVDKLEYFSPDYAHLNVSGQAAEAANIWPVVKGLMGIGG